MGRAIMILPLDKTGKNPNNLAVFEKADLVGAPLGVKILKLEHGGFYTHNLKVYDSNHRLLQRDYDYTLGYYHKKLSMSYGLDVFSTIVIHTDTVTNYVYVTAQMVGSDVAYSFTVIEDYYLFLDNVRLQNRTKETLSDKEYIGFEPIYCPGEFEKRRWKLDTYQPFNNEVYSLARYITGGISDLEEDFRHYIRDSHNRFVGGLDGMMSVHVNDFNNPHQDLKTNLGLKDVNNYRVATLAEAKAGTSNSLYLTPSLTWKVMKDRTEDLMDDHITDFNNPHELKASDLDLVSKAKVQNDASKKYYVTEVVENATRGFYKSNKNYVQMVSEFKSNIPASNFTSGRVALQRLGAGTPAANTILTSNVQRWVDWAGFIQPYISTPGDVWNAYPDKEYIEFTQGYNHIIGYAYRGTPNYSLVVYPALVYSYIVGDESHPISFRRDSMMNPFGVYKDALGEWNITIGDDY